MKAQQLKYMVYSKSRTRTKIYSSNCLHKIIWNQYITSHIHETLQKDKLNQKLQKERKQNGENQIENRKTTEKINKIKSWLFEKIKKKRQNFTYTDKEKKEGINY